MASTNTLKRALSVSDYSPVLSHKSQCLGQHPLLLLEPVVNQQPATTLKAPPYTYPLGYEVVKHYIINYNFDTWSDESKQKVLFLLVHPALTTEQRLDNVSRLWKDEDIRYTDCIHGALKETVRTVIMRHLSEEMDSYFDEAERLCANLRASHRSSTLQGTRATISLLRRLALIRDLIREPLIWYDQLLGWNYFEEPDESRGEKPWVGITPGWEFLGTGKGDYFYDLVADEGQRRWKEITYDLAQNFYTDRKTRLNFEIGSGAFPAPADLIDWEASHWDG